jgi:raffinose/stachyose/melibiose transport system permease protein
VKKSRVLTCVFALLSAAYLWPLMVLLMNSFKKKAYISRAPFAFPTEKTFEGLSNYRRGLELTDFPAALFTSLVITVLSVALILVCTSMCAWYISRVRGAVSHGIYLLCVFSMVVPFQMVMFTLAKTADTVRLFGFWGPKLNTPWTIPVIYLGFGAGLAVFMFNGFVKSIPLEIEEAASIDGCRPEQVFFKVIFPLLTPVITTVTILNGMWIWNDYLLPSMMLGQNGVVKTLPVAVQAFVGSYVKQWNLILTAALLAIIPMIVLFLFAQKQIMNGMIEGAVKG